MGRFSHVWVLVLAVVAAATSCTRPESTEQFVGIDSRENNGLYRFTIDMSDSLATYDLTFYSRIDEGRPRMASAADFPLYITLTAPSGQRFSETVFFGIHDNAKGSSFYSSQYRKPYRSGLVPVEQGVWEMTVQVNYGRDVPGMRGLGLICKKNLPDGTR